MTKKLLTLAILLSVAMVLGCGDDKKDDKKKGGNGKKTDETKAALVKVAETQNQIAKELEGINTADDAKAKKDKLVSLANDLKEVKEKMAAKEKAAMEGKTDEEKKKYSDEMQKKYEAELAKMKEASGKMAAAMTAAMAKPGVADELKEVQEAMPK